MRQFTRFLIDEEAATSVEYAVMLSMILMVIFAAVASLGDAASGLFSDAQREMDAHGVGR